MMPKTTAPSAGRARRRVGYESPHVGMSALGLKLTLLHRDAATGGSVCCQGNLAPSLVPDVFAHASFVWQG